MRIATAARGDSVGKRLGHGGVMFLVMLASAPVAVRAADYFVDPTGANGAFRTVQAAVDAVSGATEWNRANILVAPAVYREQVRITKPYVSLIGRGASPADTIVVFGSTHVFGGTWGEVMGIASSATAFMAHNLTIENSTPDRNRYAAIAVRCAADRAIFDSVRFLGYQDTLLVDEVSRQYFSRCFITGDSDFIFGDATAVFDRCTMESTDSGYITAASTRRVTANGLIFLDSTLVRGHDRNRSLDDSTTAPNASVFLGRPWRWYEPELMPSVVFIRTRMGPHIAPAGWDPWNDTGVPGIDMSADRDPRTRVSEFGSMDLNGRPSPDANGDGTPDHRAKWADVRSAQQAGYYTLDNIFGPPEFWNTSTQPDTTGVSYVSQGAPWDARAQMSRLPIPAPAVPSRALSLSTRLRVGSGENVGISGFVITGDASKKVVVRAVVLRSRLLGSRMC
ncbi:hypothetical protein BH18VER1_BH18VER1_03930 [soil metagenome]